MPEPQQSDSQKASAILSALGKLLPGIGGMLGGAGAGPPASPLISPGMPGQVPQMPGVPQVAGAGAGGGGGLPAAAPTPVMPPRMAAPMGPASQANPGTPPAPRSGAYSTGFEFGNPSARNAAVVTNAIQGVTDFITQVKQKKEAKTKAQAENYMTQITAAQQSGDKEALNLLLEDPKVVSTLEKGLDFIIPKTPGEPPPPEAMGVLSALNKMKGKQQVRLPAPNTPGGVVWPRMPQAASNQAATQDITSGAALNAVQQDPQLARTIGVGTGLSGQEAKDAERYQAGLANSPAEERRAFLASSAMMEKLAAENKQMLAEIASKEKIALAGFSSAERQQKLANSPLFYRANIAKQIADSQIKIKEMVANGKVGEANRYAMTTITSQINSLRSNATKLEKDNPDMARTFTTQADDLQKRYDEIQKANEFNVDNIINDIVNQP